MFKELLYKQDLLERIIGNVYWSVVSNSFIWVTQLLMLNLMHRCSTKLFLRKSLVKQQRFLGDWQIPCQLWLPKNDEITTKILKITLTSAYTLYASAKFSYTWVTASVSSFTGENAWDTHEKPPHIRPSPQTMRESGGIISVMSSWYYEFAWGRCFSHRLIEILSLGSAVGSYWTC